jgi:thymidylate synthase (FAD)
VSGNIRAWRDFAKAMRRAGEQFTSCFETLFKGYPALFPEFADVHVASYDRYSPVSILHPDALHHPIERLVHVDRTVKFICDRGVSHEIVRHRIASYSQESTRYCNYTDGKFGGQITFIDPCTGFGWDLETEKGESLWKYWCKAMDAAEWSYRKMLKHGATPQEARSVLPNSLKTELVITMNLREWRHFIRLRGSKAAHPQMQEVAHMIAAEFAKRYPVFFEDCV